MPRARRSPSPRARATALALLCALGLLAAFTAFVVDRATDALQDGSLDRVGAAADLTAQAVAQQELRFGEVVSASARSLPLLPLDAAQVPAAVSLLGVQRRIERLRGAATGVDRIQLADAHGRVVATTPPSAAVMALDARTRPWFRGAVATPAGVSYLSPVYVARATGRRVTAASVALRDDRGRVRGVLAFTQGSQTQRVADAAVPAGGSVVVLDGAGTVVARTGTAAARGSLRDPLVAAALDGHPRQVRRGSGRADRISGAAPVPSVGWVVLVEIPARRALAAARDLRTALVLGALVVSLVLLVLVPLLVRRLERLERRVAASDRFQADLLPAALPAGVAATYLPAEPGMLVGGDFLDAVRRSDGTLALLVGDVSGHGPRAAALGTRLRAGWRTLATTGTTLGRLGALDALCIAERSGVEIFATAAVVEVDPVARRVRWSLAGHPPPLVRGASGEPMPVTGGRGPALGLGDEGADDATWPVGEAPLEEGWLVVLYSDGLVEAPGRDGGRLGSEGLRAALAGALRPDDVLGEVRHLVAGRASDDVTVLAATAPRDDDPGA